MTIFVITLQVTRSREGGNPVLLICHGFPPSREWRVVCLFTRPSTL